MHTVYIFYKFYMRIFRMTQLAFRLLSCLLITLFYFNRQSDFSAQLPTPHPLFSSIRRSHAHPALSISSLFIHRVNWSIHTLIVTLVSHCLLVVSHVREHPNKWCVCACVSECLCASVCGCVCGPASSVSVGVRRTAYVLSNLLACGRRRFALFVLCSAQWTQHIRINWVNASDRQLIRASSVERGEYSSNSSNHLWVTSQPS